MTNTAQKIACLALLAILALPLGACNTMEGAGKDIEKAGDKLEDTARDAKN